eukprot:GGOE01044213.1.p1 GENE.GGOE01044213.1~~GGOE01044213.1.p1  ORF type:complete len:283 (-),score=70.08 GGOE01044213.1:514-1302(-)
MPPSSLKWDVLESEPCTLTFTRSPKKKNRSSCASLIELVVNTSCNDLEDLERFKKRSRSKKSRHSPDSPTRESEEADNELLEGELRSVGCTSWSEFEYKLQCVQRKYEKLKVLRKLGGDRGQETVALLNRMSDIQCTRHCRPSPKHSPTRKPGLHPNDDEMPKSAPSDDLTLLAMELAEGGGDGDRHRSNRETRHTRAVKRGPTLRPAGVDALEQLEAELRSSGEQLSDRAIASAVQRVVEALTVTRSGPFLPSALRLSPAA